MKKIIVWVLLAISSPLHAGLTESRDKIEANQKQMHTLRAALQVMSDQLQNQVQQFQVYKAQKDAQQEQVKHIQNQITTVFNQIASLGPTDDALTGLQQKIQTLQNNLAGNQTQINALQDQINELQNQIGTSPGGWLTGKNEQSSAQIVLLKARQAALSTAQVTLQTSYNAAQAILNGIQAHIISELGLSALTTVQQLINQVGAQPTMNIIKSGGDLDRLFDSLDALFDPLIANMSIMKNKIDQLLIDGGLFDQIDSNQMQTIKEMNKLIDLLKIFNSK